MPQEKHCPHCGCIIDEPKKPRSPKHHNAFFAMVDMALAAWPEGYEYQPVGFTDKQKAEDLRAWLTCKAGYRICVLKLDKQDLPPQDQLVAHYRALKAIMTETPTFPAEDQRFIYFVQPRSISWEKCDHEEFKPVFEEVKFIIEEICGIEIKFAPQGGDNT